MEALVISVHSRVAYKGGLGIWRGDECILDFLFAIQLQFR